MSYTMQDNAAQARAIAFIATLPAPFTFGIRPSASWPDLAPTKLMRPWKDALAARGEAFDVAGFGIADPRTTQAEKDVQRVTYLDACDRVTAAEDALLAWREGAKTGAKDAADKKRADVAASVLADLAKIEGQLHDVALTDRLTASLRNDDPRGRDTAIHPDSLPIAGKDAIARLRVAVTSLLPREPQEQVSQAEYRRRLAAGEDVSNVKIAHSPEGLWPKV